MSWTEAYFLFWVGVVLFWLAGMFVMARDIWRPRTAPTKPASAPNSATGESTPVKTPKRIGRGRFTKHALLTFVVAPIGSCAACGTIEPVLPIQGVAVLIFWATVFVLGIFQLVLFFTSVRRREHDRDMSGE